mgnify:CR=1 FL=1
MYWGVYGMQAERDWPCDSVGGKVLYYKVRHG